MIPLKYVHYNYKKLIVNYYFNKQIHELKTGFARAAIKSILQANSDDFAVTIIPVGLNFMNKDRFRRFFFIDFFGLFI